jgi:hypothetical protein
MWLTTRRLPFNRTVFNVVRGGGYTAIFFISGSGVGIGFLKMIMGLDVTASASQLLEWFLVGIIPIAVVLGAFLVQRRRMRVLANANRVRQGTSCRSLAPYTHEYFLNLIYTQMLSLSLSVSKFSPLSLLPCVVKLFQPWWI